VMKLSAAYGNYCLIYSLEKIKQLLRLTLFPLLKLF
jgi:hypothetical protein